ncbi:15165_t:CDS:2 [Entrophospora sp. SA101]|nr:15165_t:CDS:2 [Entrophospora sp. SA101]CAJ0838032.1 517_t:CDS:2 [Entrophospora sp. SA101]
MDSGSYSSCPSTAAKPKNFFKLQEKNPILNGRPLENTSSPIFFYHSVFGQFLFAVYDEFLRADSIQQLFIPPAPFLEDYLNSTGDGISSSISRRKLELYCDFCVVHQQYIRAAEINEYLAQKSGDDLLLKDRLRYLSHAVGHIESAKESNENERSVIVLLQKYRAEFKIAQIQFDILQDIEKISEEEYSNNATSFRKPTKTESISLLNQHLLDAKTLLNDFIIPYDLKERKSELTRVYV